jgi:hypothetical protein
MSAEATSRQRYLEGGREPIGPKPAEPTAESQRTADQINERVKKYRKGESR